MYCPPSISAASLPAAPNPPQLADVGDVGDVGVALVEDGVTRVGDANGSSDETRAWRTVVSEGDDRVS